MEFLNLLNPTEEKNTEKSHYFIGNVLDNKNLIIKLKNLNKKMKSQFQLQESHYNNLYTTNLIYLGYFDYNTAKTYMDDVYKYLLTSVTNKFSPLDCQFTNFRINRDSTYFKIELQYKDENDYINQTIIPYLYQKGIVPILGEKKYNRKGTVDCIFFKHSNIIKSKKFRIKLDIPKDKFMISNLSLIKGTPVKARSGTPSIHDQMSYEVMSDYNYTFHGNLGSNKNIASLMNRSNNNNNENVSNNKSNINISNIPSSPFNNIQNTNSQNSNTNRNNTNSQNNNSQNSNTNSQNNNSNSLNNNNRQNNNSKNNNKNNNINSKGILGLLS